MQYIQSLRRRVNAGTLEIILASASPRRAQILSQLGIPHRVLPTDTNEQTTLRRPHAIVRSLARNKAENGLSLHRSPRKRKNSGRTHIVVIGADTIVWHNNTQYGKPRNKKEARDTLISLSGATHTVYSGVCIIAAGTNTPSKIFTDVETARVTFHPLAAADISAYLATDEWRDVAGGYAIQGISAAFIKHIHGSHFTVMGLPTRAIVKRLTNPATG